MKTTITTTVLILAVILNSFSQNINKKIDDILKEFRLKNPNVSISIGFKKNNIEFINSFGNLSRESKLKVDKNSIFEIASITKMITGNLIAQAHLEKKLSVNDYIDNYLPNFYRLHKNIQNTIKISDLASHQSGLPDINFIELIKIDAQQPVGKIKQETITNLINTCSSLKDYGTYRYSTVSFILLGQILETIYQKSYAQILDEKIIVPLQLKNTYTTHFPKKNKTSGYNIKGGFQEFFNWNIVAPAGLLKSNTYDMMLFLNEILNKNSNIGKAANLSENIYYQSNRITIGLGLNILKTSKSTVYAKTGDSMGQSTVLAYDRQNKWGVIILMNQSNHKLRNELFNRIFDIIDTTE